MTAAACVRVLAWTTDEQHHGQPQIQNCAQSITVHKTDAKQQAPHDSTDVQDDFSSKGGVEFHALGVRVRRAAVEPKELQAKQKR
jgi:hypothetical protein